MSNSLPPPIPAASSSTTGPAKPQGLATASLVFGIISILGGALILMIPAILAVIFGHIAVARSAKDPQLGGRGQGLAGLILGYVSVVFWIFGAGLIAAMAIPAFQKVRDESMKKVMINDARQIAAAAQQFMLVENKKTVSFSVDPDTGKVSGPLAEYAPQIARGTTAVDGLFESDTDGFSLQNPKAYGGAVVEFDAEGRLK